MTTPGGAGTPRKACSNFPRAWPTGFYHGVGALTNRAPALRRFAPSRCPKPSPLCGCVRVHQHMIPDDMSIPSSASLAYRGGAKRSFSTYVEEEFYEVHGSKQPNRRSGKPSITTWWHASASKRSDLVLFVASFRIKGLRLVTAQLPKKLRPSGLWAQPRVHVGNDRTSPSARVQRQSDIAVIFQLK
jgi:hypothetical protein